MPIQNQTFNIPLESITFDRTNRQRTRLPVEEAVSLAKSIASKQWIADILVEKDSHRLVAGERRFTAVSLLRDSLLTPVPTWIEHLPSDELAQLRALALSCPPSWEHWTKIPGKFGYNLTELDILSFEFIENNERKDLPWQDKAKATYQIHAEGIKCTEGPWTAIDTARVMGLSAASVSKYLKIWRHHIAGEEKLQQIVSDSPTVLSALQALERVTSRREEPLVTGVATAKAPSTKPQTVDDLILPEANTEVSTPPSLAEQLLKHQSFLTFAAEYSGQPFNFIHCDFPYGLEFNTSQGQNSAVDTKQRGEYNDSEQVYWSLIESLVTNASTLISHSAHIMFWFSQTKPRGKPYRLVDKTREYFGAHFPQAKIQDFDMIWHCSNNSGIVPDPQRYGRRTYETAMLLTLGDRKIVTPKALSFAHPRINDVHRSQKPLEVLTHFFSMFIDDSTRMLDPTCGSATSVVAAHKLGAKRVLGMDLDEEMIENATRYVDRELT